MNKIDSKIMSATPEAIERLEYLINKSEKDVKAVKIGVENGGCAGMAYTMDYVDNLDVGGEIVQLNNINIVIESSALLFLLGTELDYEETKLNSGFIFNNPNQTDACGCGESVTLEQAEIPVEFNRE
tara:strand:- start:1299 stop:1679 length:381 start_codon:yes stop_codon:yes gene_type:complete